MLQFTSQADQDQFISLRGLVNKNQGRFKSEKQAQFLFKQATQIAKQNGWTSEIHNQNFGVPIQADQAVIHVDALTQWASYGSRSLVPTISVFVIDINGVVAQYKVSGSGNLREGWSPVPEKTKQVWQRDNNVVLPNYKEQSDQPAQPVNPGSWVGAVGEKIQIKAKLVRERDLGFGQFGQQFLSVLEDDRGNVINVWRRLNVNVGDSVEIKATVKDCGEFRGVKQTTLTRVYVQ